MDLKKIEGESSATQRSLSKQEKELERDRKTLDEIYESRDLWDLTTSDLADDAKEHKKAMEEQEVITKAIYDAETEINKTGEEIKIYHQTKENMDAIQGQMTKLAEIAESVKSEAKSKGITLGDDFRLEEGYLEEQYKKYNAEHDMYVKKMITAETVLKANQQAIKEKEEILKRERAKAKALIDKGNDPSTADKFREEAAAAKQYFYNIESLVRIYSKFISDIKSKNECPTCFRKFSDAEHDESRENALRELGGLVEEFNQAKEGACSLDELLAKEKKFWELELKAEPARKILEEVVPKLEDELRKLNEGMTRENIELEEAKRNEKNSLVLKNFYVQCKGLLKEQQNCEKLISILEKKVDKEMYERIDIKSLMKRHDELIETKNKKEGEKSVIQKKLVELEAQIEYNKDRANENKKAESNMVEIEAKIKKSEEEIKNIKACLEKLETESHECEKKKADIKEQVNKEKKIVEAGKKEIEMKTRRLHEIQEARKQGEKYVNTAMFSVKEAESKYTSAKESLSQVKADGLDAEIAHSEQEVEMLSGAVNRRSEIDNELNTVRCLNEFMECCKTIRELNKIFNEDEFEKMVEKQNTLKDSLSKEEGKCESARGRLENLKEELKGIKEHDQIDNKIRDIRIEIIVREKAAADYEMYQKGLDGAIMKYHETQMEEINSVIRDLWQETYCHGNWHEDIDYIKIVSDLDTADGRKSYNYRVVMVKNGKEIGMNGRCSAGQKVLASLVIRMAIAEVFCANCGVFAIDEPSTNLDEHNSVALARALGGLIEKRKSLLSFQLIVITHDQIFTDILGRGYCSGYYYEVSKDKKSGKSTITRKPIEAITH